MKSIKKIRQSVWAVFWRKLESLLDGGMSLMDAMRHLERSSDEPLRTVLVKACSRLESGEPFCEIMGESNALWYGVLLAGERAGNLSDAVSRLADRIDAQMALRSQVTSALVYPAMVAVLCVAIVFLLSGLLVPRFASLFESLDIQDGLPVLTQAIFDFSEFVRHDGGWGLLALLVLVGVLRWHQLRAPATYEKILLAVPVFGGLYAQGVGLNVIKSLSVLLNGNMPLDEALDISASGCASAHCQAILQTAALRVKEGDSLSSALSGSKFWDATDIELLTIAEHSGQLAQTTQRLAQLNHDKFVRQTQMATRLIEPLLIMLMAVLVGVLLVALFSPLMPLIGRLSEGGF